MADGQDSKLKKLGRFALKTSPAGMAASALRHQSDAVSEETFEGEPCVEAQVEGMDEPGQADALESYKVNYRGGHPDYPKPKVSALNLGLYPDRFEIQPTRSAKGWFRGITVPYDQVRDVQIVARNVSTFEAVAGGLNSRQLNQDNNIHIVYESGGREVVLRLEMLAGVTVMGQAKKCREFEDRLRNLGISDRFKSTAQPAAGQAFSTATDDIPGQIAKLAALRDQGILSDEEFQMKKTELLERL